MKPMKIILFMIVMTLIAGCGEQEGEQKLDCKDPRNKQEQQECAHEASTSSNAIPSTRPTKNKKW
jgi:hypothetical protein